MEKFFFSRNRGQRSFQCRTSDKSTKLVRQNLKKLIKSIFDCGRIRRVYLNQFAILYQQTFGVPINHEDPRKRDVKTFLIEEAPDILLIREKYGKTFIVPNFKIKKPNLDQQLLSAIPEEHISVPYYVLGPKDTIPSLNLYEHIFFGRTIELSLCNNPSESVMYARLTAHTEEFVFFSNRLQFFYRKNANRLWMPDHLKKPGQYCAVLVVEGPAYPLQWQRGQIYSVRYHRASVFLVDEGAVIETDKKFIRYLHKNFNVFPMQALQITTKH